MQGLGLEQVGRRADGHLLLQAPGAAAAAHQHEGVLRVRLQTRDQLPPLVARHLHAVLVVQDLVGRQSKGCVRGKFRYLLVGYAFSCAIKYFVDVSGK